jgi:hypothetical protein
LGGELPAGQDAALLRPSTASGFASLCKVVGEKVARLDDDAYEAAIATPPVLAGLASASARSGRPPMRATART